MNADPGRKSGPNTCFRDELTEEGPDRGSGLSGSSQGSPVPSQDRLLRRARRELSHRPSVGLGMLTGRDGSAGRSASG